MAPRFDNSWLHTLERQRLAAEQRATRLNEELERVRAERDSERRRADAAEAATRNAWKASFGPIRERGKS
jgi:hypothetical protein